VKRKIFSTRGENPLGGKGMSLCETAEVIQRPGVYNRPTYHDAPCVKVLKAALGCHAREDSVLSKQDPSCLSAGAGVRIIAQDVEAGQGTRKLVLIFSFYHCLLARVACVPFS
jgi:hypothetical protein